MKLFERKPRCPDCKTDMVYPLIDESHGDIVLMVCDSCGKRFKEDMSKNSYIKELFELCVRQREVSSNNNHRTKNYTNPKYREGSLIKIVMKSGDTIYRVNGIIKSEYGLTYDLVGVKSVNKEFKRTSEYRSYQPFCEWIDKEAEEIS